MFRGNTSALEGRDIRAALGSALEAHLSEIYTRLDEFTAPVKRGDAVSLIRADDLSGLPEYLGPDGLQAIKIESDGYKIDETGPVAEFLSVVRARMEYGSEATGKYFESSLPTSAVRCRAGRCHGGGRCRDPGRVRGGGAGRELAHAPARTPASTKCSARFPSSVLRHSVLAKNSM